LVVVGRRGITFPLVLLPVVLLLFCLFLQKTPGVRPADAVGRGEAFIIDGSRDLRRICAMIANQMHTQYSLGYYPAKTAEGEWRTIRLETTTRGYRVVASKTGYFGAEMPPENQ
jgi:hypothetical protein